MSELWTGYPNIEDTTLHFEFVLDMKAEQFLMMTLECINLC